MKINHLFLIALLCSAVIISAAADRQEQLNCQLFEALECNASFETVKTLIDSKADVNARDWFNRTPCHIAACSDDRWDCIEIFSKKGADINAKDDYGNTPLHNACSMGSINAAQALLKCDANTQEKRKWGMTPKDIAQLYGRKEIIVLLEDYEKMAYIKEPEGD